MKSKSKIKCDKCGHHADPMERYLIDYDKVWKDPCASLGLHNADEVQRLTILLFSHEKKPYITKDQKENLVSLIKDFFSSLDGVDMTVSQVAHTSTSDKNPGRLITDGVVFRDKNGAVVFVVKFDGNVVTIHIAHNLMKVGEDTIQVFVDGLASAFPSCKLSFTPLRHDDKVTMSIIMPGMQDPIYKSFSKISYASIRNNYSAVPEPGRKFSTRELLDRLVNDFNPRIGRIVLLHGQPGTGKSYFLRSLISEDTERHPVFVQNAASFLQNFGNLVNTSAKKQIFIFEDAGALLDSQRRLQVDLFANLLNITDGLLAANDDMYVFTFNCSIGEIDPAFRRPGRMFADIYFSNLTEEEAIAFLKDKLPKDKNQDDVINRILQEIVVAGRYNLATLYSMIYTDTPLSSQPKKATIGFKR
jgi:hypothetical protein